MIVDCLAWTDWIVTLFILLGVLAFGVIWGINIEKYKVEGKDWVMSWLMNKYNKK